MYLNKNYFKIISNYFPEYTKHILDGSILYSNIYDIYEIMQLISFFSKPTYIT